MQMVFITSENLEKWVYGPGFISWLVSFRSASKLWNSSGMITITSMHMPSFRNTFYLRRKSLSKVADFCVGGNWPATLNSTHIYTTHTVYNRTQTYIHIYIYINSIYRYIHRDMYVHIVKLYITHVEHLYFRETK